MSTKKKEADTKPDEPIVFTPAPALVERVETGPPPTSPVEPTIDVTEVPASQPEEKPEIPNGMSAFEWALLKGHKGHKMPENEPPVVKDDKA